MQCCCQHRPHDTLRVTLLPPAAAWCGYNSCLFVKSEKKFKFWTDPQYNEIEISSVKITEYAIIAMRGVDCVTLTKTTEGPRYGTLSLLRIWNTHYTPDDASGSVLTVCRPLIGHSEQTLPSHWLIEWWILFTLGTKEKMMSSKNVWVDNIHECLGMKTRMAISQFYSDPVPRTRTWLFTRTRWITITGGAWH